MHLFFLYSLSQPRLFLWLHTTLWLYIAPELGLIVIHLHLPCLKLQVPLFSPPLTPDAAIMWIPLLPQVEAFSCGGVSARRESSSFRFHFLSFSFSSSHFFSKGVIKADFPKSFPLFFSFFSFYHQHPQSQSLAWKAACVSAARREAEPLDLSLLSVFLFACRVMIPENLQFTEENSARTLPPTFTMIHDSPSNLLPNLRARLARKPSPLTTPIFSLTLLFASNPFFCIKKTEQKTTCFCFHVLELLSNWGHILSQFEYLLQSGFLLIHIRMGINQ